MSGFDIDIDIHIVIVIDESRPFSNLSSLISLSFLPFRRDSALQYVGTYLIVTLHAYYQYLISSFQNHLPIHIHSSMKYEVIPINSRISHTMNPTTLSASNDYKAVTYLTDLLSEYTYLSLKAGYIWKNITLMLHCMSQAKVQHFTVQYTNGTSRFRS